MAVRFPSPKTPPLIAASGGASALGGIMIASTVAP
jgi:hypothetical protein